MSLVRFFNSPYNQSYNQPYYQPYYNRPLFEIQL
jgi:hypothetical protein